MLVDYASPLKTLFRTFRDILLSINILNIFMVPLVFLFSFLFVSVRSSVELAGKVVLCLCYQQAFKFYPYSHPEEERSLTIHFFKLLQMFADRSVGCLMEHLLEIY